MKEITSQLFEARDGDGILDINNTIMVEYFANDMDGIFVRPASWTRFINQVDKDYEKLAKYLSYGDKQDGIEMVDYETIIVHSSKGIEILSGFTLDENGTKQQVITLAHHITLRISYDWLFSRTEQKATAIEIYGKYVNVA